VNTASAESRVTNVHANPTSEERVCLDKSHKRPREDVDCDATTMTEPAAIEVPKHAVCVVPDGPRGNVVALDPHPKKKRRRSVAKSCKRPRVDDDITAQQPQKKKQCTPVAFAATAVQVKRQKRTRRKAKSQYPFISPAH